MSILMLLGFSLVEQIWFSFQPLLSAAGMRPFEVGLSYAFGACASVIGARIGKWLMVGHRDALAFSLAVAVCARGGLLFAVAAAPGLVVTAQIVTCVGFGIIASSRGSILNAYFPSAQRDVCLSIFSSTEAVLSGLMGMTLGYIYENYHRSLAPTIVATACLLLVPFAYRSLRRIKTLGL